MLVWQVANPAPGESWPAFRHDAQRSGITAEQLKFPLSEAWRFEPRHAPRPAWGDPKPGPVEEILELRRAHFDDVFQVAAGNDAVYFGSSADHKLYCLDAASGATRWTFLADGPIRLAPMLVGDRLYFAADDGCAYCLDTRDGREIYRFQAAPDDRRLLGQGKLISRWPSRTGVLVDTGVAYVGAGVFPAEGVFLYALSADDGRLLWKNDVTGEHPQSRVSPQGYLLASPSTLFAPMARVSPAAFDRRDGRLLYQTSFGKNVGGSYALLAGDQVFTGTEQMVGFKQDTRDQFATFPGRRMVVTDQFYYQATDTQLMALDRQSRTTRWNTPSTCWFELILAGDTLIAGGEGEVVAVDAVSGEQKWRASVDGAANGLAVADGRLLVSTDRGTIYSFGPAGTPQYGKIVQPMVEDPLDASPQRDFVRQAARSILEHSGVRQGYCLLWGCETGQLAWELARQSELTIYAVSPDADKVAAVREKLDAAGLLGARVTVEQHDLGELPYADYFANLVVSETALLSGQLPADPGPILRMVKPLGGTLVFGQPSGAATGSTAWDAAAAAGKLARAGFSEPEHITADGSWVKLVRGGLPGAGSWTHQYADAGNTACGDDQMLKAPLGVLWFGQPGAGEMINRHVRAAGPLSLDGRLFIQGENVLMAYDIYNGVPLWRREIPGAARTNASHDGSNLAVCQQGLFVAIGDHCLRLDVATGETQATYPLPPAEGNYRRWGYLATDGQRLYGSRAAGAGQSDLLFARDVASGELLWQHPGQPIAHNAIALFSDAVYLVASDVTEQQHEQAAQGRQAEIAALPESQRAAAQGIASAVRRVVCLDKKTGEIRWQQALDLADCGNATSLMATDGVLVLFGVYLDGHYWQQFFAGQFASRRVIALDASSGSTLWSQPVGYRVRPLIVGDTLHAEPWAFDLHTGQPRTRLHPVTGVQERWQFARPGHHCGCPSASTNCLFFRSWNLGYYDLLGDYGTMHFAGQRPGCWINSIAAGGLALMPEASTGCMCDFPNHGTVVFQPVERNQAWAWYSADGALTPVKQLALNLGAAGDRRDSQGNLWLAYPRPQGSLVLPLKAQEAFHSGGRFIQANSVYATTSGTADPWLFSSAARGLRRLHVPLLKPGDGTAEYDVRLLLADPDNSTAGQRVFDIQLQGAVVAADYDIVAAAGAANTAVTAEFTGVLVDDVLNLELVPKTPSLPSHQLPIVQGLEIVRQRFVSPGCTVPTFVLNRSEPEKTAEIQLVNLCDHAFHGSLQIEPVEGVEPSWRQQAVQLERGQRISLPVSVKSAGPAGLYTLPVRLVSDDGRAALQRQMQVEHLGTRARVALAPTADAHVAQRYPSRNTGTSAVLLVDGGNQQLQDQDHALAYLKYSLDLPGKPVGASLRIVNAGNPSGASGRICIVGNAWEETTITYENRPQPGTEAARIGPLSENQTVDCELSAELPQRGEFSLVIDPTSLDGVDYLSREAGRPAELIVEYETQP